MIIRDLFINLCILVSFLFFYSQFSNRFPLSYKSPLKIKILTGVLGGLLSNILMQFSINIEITIMDLRHVPTILLAYYGGAIPALISMLFTIVGRFLVSTNLASFSAIIISVSGTIFAIYLSRSNYSKNMKIFLIVSFNNLIYSILFSFLVHDLLSILIAIPIYWIVSYLSAYLAFFILGYIRKSQKLFNKYKDESVTDCLTGLNNVRKFDEIYNNLIKRIKMKEQNVSLLYIDIDFFKQVNDSYGHVEGDLVLKELGERLQNNTRPFDIVSRNGGEEFTVVLIDCSLNKAVEIAERIRSEIECNPFTLNSGREIDLTVSIGLASYQETTNDPVMLVEDADRALYHAKNSGRNKVCIASIVNNDCPI